MLPDERTFKGQKSDLAGGGFPQDEEAVFVAGGHCRFPAVPADDAPRRSGLALYRQMLHNADVKRSGVNASPHLAESMGGQVQC